MNTGTSFSAYVLQTKSFWAKNWRNLRNGINNKIKCKTTSIGCHFGSSVFILALLPLDGFDFRDLVCLECTGSSCPVVRYKSPINDMVVGCQSCYKEWTHGKSTDSRIRKEKFKHTNSAFFNLGTFGMLQNFTLPTL